MLQLIKFNYNYIIIDFEYFSLFLPIKYCNFYALSHNYFMEIKMLNIPFRSEVEEYFTRYGERLCKCIGESFYHFRQKHSEDSFKYEIRTKAGIVRDLIVDSLKNEFGFEKNVSFLVDQYGTFMVMDHKYLLRVKKFKENLSTSNYQTPRAQDYASNLNIPGIPIAPLRLEVGYLPDALFTEIKGIYIVRSVDNVPQWSIRLDNSDIESGIPTDMFDPISAPTIEVKLKKGMIRREGSNDDNR